MHLGGLEPHGRQIAVAQRTQSAGGNHGADPAPPAQHDATHRSHPIPHPNPPPHTQHHTFSATPHNARHALPPSPPLAHAQHTVNLHTSARDGNTTRLHCSRRRPASNHRTVRTRSHSYTETLTYPPTPRPHSQQPPPSSHHPPLFPYSYTTPFHIHTLLTQHTLQH